MKSGPKTLAEIVLVRLFYPAHAPEQVRTRPKSGFQKVGECLYRYLSNGVYYARFESGGKEIRRSVRSTDREKDDARNNPPQAQPRGRTRRYYSAW
jgi:hypothetical protein